MIKFPSINQFRQVVTEVQRKARFMGLDGAGEPIINHAAKAPTLSFQGTVKLHGTNAAVVFTNGETTFQSRERELTESTDNAGFFNHMKLHLQALHGLEYQIKEIAGLSNADNTIAIFGEWCGGNIQTNVAINGLPKMFVIFAIQANGVWLDMQHYGQVVSKEASIYNVRNFPTYHLLIDFDRPENAQNALAQITEQVEAKCPVGFDFGNEGVGEGVVWTCTSDPSSNYWFKVKGEKHSASKVKVLAQVDVEVIAKAHDFVAMAVTPSRLEQGFKNLTDEQLKPADMTSMGDFIRWVHNDVMKEEADTLMANQLNPKQLGGLIAQASKRWYIERLNTF